MSDHPFRGILCIGDPHLCTWSPGYRKDEYAQTVLKKLRWALEYAREHSLLTVLLGDLFHVPINNANWMLTVLLELLDGRLLTIIGNHDLSENQLSEHDSLRVLFAANRLRPLDGSPWRGTINDVSVVIGGTNNGQHIPRLVDRAELGNPRYVFWITHHDIRFPGYDETGRLDCVEIPGIDLIVNGHIHRQLPDVISGCTTWCNPGNIARVNRSDATRQHVPGVLRIDVDYNGWAKTRIDVPCLPFEEVFHPLEESAAQSLGASAFIAGLQSMQKFKTADGEGLRRVIEENLPKFSSERVKKEILRLLNEVLPYGSTVNDSAEH